MSREMPNTDSRDIDPENPWPLGSYLWFRRNDIYARDKAEIAMRRGVVAHLWGQGGPCDGG